MKLNRTVLRATQVLSLLSKTQDGMTLSEIAENLLMPQASTHDIVKTLLQTHFLRESGKRYYVVMAAKDAGDGYQQDKDMLWIAKKHIIAMADKILSTG